jgi:tetratricopeptide (TPR) repeat protein
MKWVFYVILLGLAVTSWSFFSKKGSEINVLKLQIEQLENVGDPDEVLPEMYDKLNALDGDRTLSGIMLTFVGAGIVGIFFVVYLLPFFAQRLTHAVYDSAEMVEKDVMRDARSCMAQGDYEGAIEAFKEAAKADPLNRLPWVEIAKVYKDNLKDSDSAVQTIRHALESQEWEVTDAAYFLFRLAELYDEVQGDRQSAKAIMEQVIAEFEGTRHSANASHKLHEWKVEEEAGGGAVADASGEKSRQRSLDEEKRRQEEEEFLARMKKQQDENGGPPPRMN